MKLALVYLVSGASDSAILLTLCTLQITILLLLLLLLLLDGYLLTLCALICSSSSIIIKASSVARKPMTYMTVDEWMACHMVLYDWLASTRHLWVTLMCSQPCPPRIHPASFSGEPWVDRRWNTLSTIVRLLYGLRPRAIHRADKDAILCMARYYDFQS